MWTSLSALTGSRRSVIDISIIKKKKKKRHVYLWNNHWRTTYWLTPLPLEWDIRHQWYVSTWLDHLQHAVCIDVQAHLHGKSVQSVCLFLEMFEFCGEYSKVTGKVKFFKLWEGGLLDASGSVSCCFPHYPVVCDHKEDWRDDTALRHTRLYREPFWQVSVYNDAAFDFPVEHPHQRNFGETPQDSMIFHNHVAV